VCEKTPGHAAGVKSLIRDIRAPNVQAFLAVQPVNQFVIDLPAFAL
jgi:hypothetical protein